MKAVGEMKKGRLKAVSFESLGLSPEGCAAMKRCNFHKPTAFQEKALPHILAGKDFMGKYVRDVSSGKTATYLVGMLERFIKNRAAGGIKALILMPDFDTAWVSYRDAHEMALAAKIDIEIGMVAGGVNMERPVEEMVKNYQLDAIIATPNNLLPVLDSNPNSLSNVEYVVIDGPQQMIRMGFVEQLHQILGKVSENRQALIFTSKYTRRVARFIDQVLRQPESVIPCKDAPVESVDSLNLIFLNLRMDRRSPNSIIPCSDLTTKKRHAIDVEEESSQGAPGLKRRATNPMLGYRGKNHT